MPELLRVTARMKAPISLNNPLNLDGIVVYAVYQEAVDTAPAPTQLPSRGGEIPGLDLRSIPISVWPGDHEDFVFLSSDMEHNGKRRKSRFIKRRDAVDHHYLKRKVHTGGGPWKDMIKPVSMIAADHLHWVCVGDGDEILRLLTKHITHVGMHRAQGFGRVHGRLRSRTGGWAVERLKGQFSDAIWRDGLSRRTLPATLCSAERSPVMLPIRPPHWHRGNLRPAFPSGTEAWDLYGKHSWRDDLVVHNGDVRGKATGESGKQKPKRRSRRRRRRRSSEAQFSRHIEEPPESQIWDGVEDLCAGGKETSS